MSFNPQDDVRQLRFRDNLRWYLKNEAALRLSQAQGQLQARYILEIFHEVSASFAEGSIDTFNAVVEHYRGGGRKEPGCPQGLAWGHIIEVSRLPSATR